MIVVFLLSVGFVFAGCRRPADQTGVVAYACPMRCEDEKTYAQPGRCPVCGMELVQVTANGELVMPVPPPGRTGSGP